MLLINQMIQIIMYSRITFNIKIHMICIIKHYSILQEIITEAKNKVQKIQTITNNHMEPGLNNQDIKVKDTIQTENTMTYFFIN